MKTIRSKEFRAKKAWEAQDIAVIEGASVRLHWTDQPYSWHANDGEEVFIVLSGRVEMHYLKEGEKRKTILEEGDIFFADLGEEHSAHPIGEARVLVVEKKGSI